MQVVTPRMDIDVPVERGRKMIHLARGIPYAMHDVEVASGSKHGVFREVGPLPDQPRRLDGRNSPGGRLIMPFIGGLGDAVSILPLLQQIKERSPGITLEITTTPGPAELFSLATMVDRVVAYPLKLSTWRRYDHWLSMETVRNTGQQPGQSLAATFARSVGMELDDHPFEQKLLNIDQAEKVGALDAIPSPRIGLVWGGSGNLRGYPPTRFEALLDILQREGMGVAVLGDAEEGLRLDVPSGAVDLRGRTATLSELASVLREVDLVVAHDSFIMHFAGLLHLLTIALFAPTSSEHATPYPTVHPVRSYAACAPCHCAGATCPRGLPSCVAWDDEATSPQRIARMIARRVSTSGVMNV